MNIRNGREEKTETVRKDGRQARTKQKTMAKPKSGGNDGKRNEEGCRRLESSQRKSYCSRTPRLEQSTERGSVCEWSVCYKQGQHNQGKEVGRSWPRDRRAS